MILIVCLDDKNGMSFGGRRQSRDRVLTERIKSMAADKRLFMSEYSAKLYGGGVIACDNFTEMAKEGDLCFIENTLPPNGDIEKIIIYKWNRDYPADLYFTLDLDEFIQTSEYEFEGSSHEKITELVYVRSA